MEFGYCPGLVRGDAVIGGRSGIGHGLRALSIAAAIVVLSGLAGGVSLEQTRPAGEFPGRLLAERSAMPPANTVPLVVAASLAVSPGGGLYVAAPGQHRILERVPGGKFKVVAGTGISGFSGDGGPAIEAELSAPSHLAFGTNGDLFFVDGDRVRVVYPDGLIDTVAGSGANATIRPIRSGVRALSASLGPVLSIAVEGTRTLYICTLTQIMQLTAAGDLETVPDRRASLGNSVLPTSLDQNLTGVAVSSDGIIYVTGFSGWAIWRIDKGVGTYVGVDRGTGGNVPDTVGGPEGSVFTGDGSTVMRVVGKDLRPFVRVGSVAVDGTAFALSYFAVGPGGVLYADSLPGGEGFGKYQKLIEIVQGRASLLWMGR